LSPTGSVVINGGAAATKNPAVTLTLSATDVGGSGVAQMRLSNDNVSWSAWETYTTSKAWTLPAGVGTKTVYVQYRDHAGNTSTSTWDTIHFDNEPPVGSVVINGGDASTMSRTVTLALSANADGYRVRFSNNGTSWSAYQVIVATQAWTLTVGDGLKTVYAQFMDVYGNTAIYSDTITLGPTPDTTLPTGSVTINGGAESTADRAVTLTLSASDTGGSGLSQMQFSNDNATWSAWQAYATSRSWTLDAGDGTKTVYARFRDGAGNVSATYTDSITLATADAIAPTGSIAINGGAASTYGVVVTLTLSGSDTGGSGLSEMRLSNDGGAWTEWEAFATTRGWLLESDLGTKTVYVQFRDVAGNVSATYSDTIELEVASGTTAATTLLIDEIVWVDATVGASGAWATYSIYINDTLVGTKYASSDPTWACPGFDVPTGSHIDIVVDCGFTSYDDIFDQVRPLTFTRTLPAGVTRLEPATWTGFANMNTGTDWWDDYGDYYAAVWVPNSTISNIVYTVPASEDTVAPTGSVTINGGAASTSSTAVTLTLAATDTGGSGLAQMQFSNDNATWSAWQAYTASKSWTLTPGDGTRTVSVRFRDGAGNESAVFSDTIELEAVDLSAPTGSVSINDGAASTNSATVTLTLDATDTGGSGLAEMQFSHDSVNWSSWEAYATTRSWTLGAGTGTKTVYVRFRDAAANVSAAYSDTITVVDESAPTGSITINGGDETATFRTVSLTLAATDTGGSGLSQMQFSNDNVTWSTWEAFLTAKVWTLEAGTGTRTVYARFRDVAGNVSATYSDTIDLEAASGTTAATTLAITDVAWVDANVGSSGEWATYSIYVNDTLVGTKSAASGPTWAFPGLDVSAGGHIDIVVDCGFTSYDYIFDQVRPITFTLTLPANTVRLEPATWTGFPAMGTGTDWWDDYGDYYSAVWVPGGTISNIVYTTTTPADTIAPTGSITISGGASSTSSNAVTLTLAASDTGGSGLAQMQFSNDGVSWSAWQAYATSKSWTLTSGDGTKTVYARFSDVAGNVSTPYSDSIELVVAESATLSFQWWGYGYAELHVEDASGTIIASTSVEGSMGDLTWNVTVPSGANYRMVCDYYWDDDYGMEGGGYGVWSNSTTINADGVLSPGETVIWYY